MVRCNALRPTIQRIARRYAGVLVRGDPQRPEAGHLDQPAQEPPCRLLVAVLAEHRIDQRAITVDGPVQVAPASRDLHVRLVQVPGGASLFSALCAQLRSEQRSEAELPSADGLVRDLETALEQRLGDIAEAQLVPQAQSTASSTMSVGYWRIVEWSAGPLVEATPAGATIEPSIAECGAAGPSCRRS